MRDADPLWRIAMAGGERRPAGTPYAWDNRDREPADIVILQTVDEGRVEVRPGDGRVLLADAGSVFLVRYGEPSWYGFPAGQRLAHRTRWLALRGAGLAEHWDLIRAGAGWVLPLDATIERHLRDGTALADPAARTPPLTMAAAVAALVLDLCAIARASAAAAADPVDRAIAEIVAAPWVDWSLKAVADSHGISREHLTRVFTRRLGRPPATWLTETRLERALVLLRETRQEVAAIARACGLGSAHTLARLVRARTGRPPSALRSDQPPPRR
jgi:AraC-like DNA-binding protein